MYRLGHASRGRLSRRKNNRILSVSTVILFAVLCAASALVALQGKDHAGLKGTGAYFDDTESAAVQFEITFGGQRTQAQPGVASAASQTSDPAQGGVPDSAASSQQEASGTSTPEQPSGPQAESSQAAEPQSDPSRAADSQKIDSQSQSAPPTAEEGGGTENDSAAGADSAGSSTEIPKADESGR